MTIIDEHRTLHPSQRSYRRVVLMALAMIAAGAGAQGYPVKPVRFIVPYAYGVLAPVGTPREIVKRLHGSLAQIMRTAEIVDRIVRDASIPIGGTPAEFAVYLRDEIAKWAKVVAASGARVE